MADVPTVTAPQQALTGAPVRVNAPAEAFGASVLGEGLSKLGQTEQHNSDVLAQHAQQFMEVNNRLAADKATMSTVQQVDAYREKYAAENNGIAAYDNLGTAFKDLQGIQDSHAQGLSGPAQAEYLQASRRYVAGVQSQLTSLALTARHKDMVDTKTGLVSTLQAHAVANIDDPDVVRADAEAIGKQIGDLSGPQYLGLPHEQAVAEMQKAVGYIYASGAKLAIDAGDVPKAQAIYAAHKDEMTAEQQVAIAGALRSGAQDFVIKGFADDIMEGRAPVDRSPAVAGAANAEPLDRGAYLAAIGQREGTGQNPRSSAVGTGQFINSTWLATLKGDPQFAQDIAGKSDAQILALRQDATVANRAIISYGDANGRKLEAAGFAPTSANVGLAHGFGIGGAKALLQAEPDRPVSQVLPAEVIRANPELANQTAGQVVAGFQRRFGGPSTGPSAPSVPIPPPPTITPNSDPAQVRADYDTYILAAANARFPHNPVMEEKAVAAARNQVAIKIQALATSQLAAYNRLDAAISGGTQSGNSVAEIGDLKSAYPGSASDLAMLPPGTYKELQNHVNSSAQGYGAYNTPAMQARADELIGLSGSDPATFADPSRTNIAAEHISAPNKAKLLSLQASLERKADAQAASASKLSNLLKDPVVANITKGLDQTHYNQFIGALQGRIDALGRDVKPGEVGTIAQTILSETSIGNSKYGGIPQEAKDKINAMYQKALKRDANDIELYRAYQQGPKYYGG